MIRINRTKTLFVFVVIACTYFGCSSVKYETPKNQDEIELKNSIDKILENIKSECSPENKSKLEKIGVKFNRKSFSITTNSQRSILFLPSYNSLSKKSANSFSTYIDDVCLEVEDCKKELVDYISIYYFIHELFHAVNPHRYKKKFKGSHIRKKGKTIMSFDEELKADAVVDKYLSKYNPKKLAELNEIFSGVLESQKFSKNHEEIKANWNNFLKDEMEISLTKLYLFTYVHQQNNKSDIEDLLFPKN